MQRTDALILASVVLLSVLALYAAVAGSDYSSAHTPIERLLLPEARAPAPREEPPGSAAKTGGAFEVVESETADGEPPPAEGKPAADPEPPEETPEPPPPRKHPKADDGKEVF